ncbi:unnamed protein product, partial [Closterium sp. NIES-53]
ALPAAAHPQNRPLHQLLHPRHPRQLHHDYHSHPCQLLRRRVTAQGSETAVQDGLAWQ